MRAVESSVSSHGTLNPLMVGQINSFSLLMNLIPTCMITNFHTPKSTLLMMVSAFCGHDLMKRAYEEAIKEEYKFYSYGDAMLII
jgi:S-adenosylmethionine:tRNA ribosyltransferase-isomerase